MPRASDKRDKLIRSADRLILEQGYKRTTLSDIANASGVPLGNVYYYFRTKEEIAHTVIEMRLAAIRQVLSDCSRASDDPRARLLAFLEYPLQTRDSLRAHGCPLGTLAYEISRDDDPLNASAGVLVSVLLDWCREQFQALGRADAAQLALQMVSSLQGMSLVANALQDTTVVEQIVDRTRSWINNL